ncbi:TlpA family protein disulfide reductase [Rhodospirillaceae bacterium AH-315-P19]|nr:TlpA family protein disulfide reductase [Rhodospirillaceae bacterium AH-315-P19]
MPTDSIPTALHFTPLSKPLPVPDVPFIDADGSERRFADWRGKGIVLNFWATWCGPCVREMPSLDRLAGRVAGEGIVVIPLSGDRGGLAVVKAFYERLEIKNLAIYLDPKRAVGAEFGVEFLPFTVFIGRDGQVLGSLSGFVEWDSPEGLALVRRYLGKPDSHARD